MGTRTLAFDPASYTLSFSIDLIGNAVASAVVLQENMKMYIFSSVGASK